MSGTTSCSVTASSNGKGSWATASNSKICYANVVEAVGIIEIKITGSTSSSLDSSHSSYSFGCTASIQDISASGSGNTTVLLNVGETPVSGQIQITLNTNAGITSFSTGYTSSASCSVVSVKYKSDAIPESRNYHPEGDKITWSSTSASYAICTAYSTWAYAETGWINFDNIIAVSSKYVLGGNGEKGYIYLLEQGTNRKLTICEPHYTHSSNTAPIEYDGVTYTYMARGEVTGSLDTSSIKGLYKICYEGSSYNGSAQAWFYPVEAIFSQQSSSNIVEINFEGEGKIWYRVSNNSDNVSVSNF